MELACMLYHGGKDMPVEAMRHPHVELIASNEREMRALKAAADQLRQFGCVPFSYKEVEGTSPGASRGAVLRIALCERPVSGVTQTCEGVASVSPQQ